jgi:hypothetical protein
MPRYYFDVSDGSRTFEDDAGDDLADDLAARTHLRRLLVEQAAGLLRHEDTGQIIVKVRDISGSRFTVKLSVTEE